MGAEPIVAEPMGAEPMGAEPMGAEPMGAEPIVAVAETSTWRPAYTALELSGGVPDGPQPNGRPEGGTQVVTGDAAAADVGLSDYPPLDAAPLGTMPVDTPYQNATPHQDAVPCQDAAPYQEAAVAQQDMPPLVDASPQGRSTAVLDTDAPAVDEAADEWVASPVNYDDDGLAEVEVEGEIYRFDSGKQGTALCLSRRAEGTWQWRYLGELRWDGRDLRSKQLERRLLGELSLALRQVGSGSDQMEC